MKKHKLNTLLVAIFFITIHNVLYAQKFDRAGIEGTIHKAVNKAYNTSVRIWGFDIVKQMQTSGQFSGVVVSAEGHILTAAHVNVPGNTYKVMFADGTEYFAKGLGEIELAGNRTIPDVAMMKIMGKFKGPYAEMGWSYSLRKDEPCISIAYPESLNQPLPTVRFGRIADPNNKYGFVQSTCIMEPGDSGGPLFDYLGRVVGLHSAIDVSESDNFEVPVDLYRKYWTALNKEETYKEHPQLKDTVGIDPLIGKIITVPGLQKPEKNFTALISRLNTYSLPVQSNINGIVQTVFGTLFSLKESTFDKKFDNRSILVSKSSMVGEDPGVVWKGKKIEARVILRDKETDLILLEMDWKRNSGIEVAQLNPDTSDFEQPGKFLISPLVGDTSKISVLGSREISLPKLASSAYLGTEVEMKQGWVTLTDIKQGSPAAEAGLKQGDQVLNLNGINIETSDDFSNALKKYWPGDEIKIKVMRPDSLRSVDITLIKEVVLGSRPQRNNGHPAEMFAGGKSSRRDGFAGVFVHDAVLRPEQCGGPVFDAAGRFYGINIARYSRTASLIIPSQSVLRLIDRYIQSELSASMLSKQ